MPDAEPDGGPEQRAASGREIPDQGGDAAHDEADYGECPVQRLAPSHYRYRPSIEDRTGSRRFQHGRQANRHARVVRRGPRAKGPRRRRDWRVCGECITARMLRFAGLAWYRGVRRPVSPSGFLHGHAFYRRMQCAFSSERIDAGTDVNLSQNDASAIRAGAKPHVMRAALLRTSPARNARRCGPCAYCAAAIGCAARRAGPPAVSYLRKRLS